MGKVHTGQTMHVDLCTIKSEETNETYLMGVAVITPWDFYEVEPMASRREAIGWVQELTRRHQAVRRMVCDQAPELLKAAEVAEVDVVAGTAGVNDSTARAENAVGIVKNCVRA